MYSETITLFCRYVNDKKDTFWIPTVICGANLQADRASIIEKYGSQSKDTATLNVRYDAVDGEIYVSGKRYVEPKEWARRTLEEAKAAVTFDPGVTAGFFWRGRWSETGPVSDSDYLDGFYDYMNGMYDGVYTITAVARYSVIPHFEVMGR